MMQLFSPSSDHVNVGCEESSFKSMVSSQHLVARSLSEAVGRSRAQQTYQWVSVGSIAPTSRYFCFCCIGLFENYGATQEFDA